MKSTPTCCYQNAEGFSYNFAVCAGEGAGESWVSSLTPLQLQLPVTDSKII